MCGQRASRATACGSTRRRCPAELLHAAAWIPHDPPSPTARRGAPGVWHGRRRRLRHQAPRPTWARDRRRADRATSRGAAWTGAEGRGAPRRRAWPIARDGRQRTSAPPYPDEDGAAAARSRGWSGWSCARRGRLKHRCRPGTTHYRTCPFCEATCGLEVEWTAASGVGARRRAGRVQRRLPLPQGDGREAPAGGPRPAAEPHLNQRDGELRGDRLGRGAARGGRAARAASSATATAMRWRRTWATRAPTTWRLVYGPVPGRSARATSPPRRARSTRSPSTSPSGRCSATRLVRGARHRPHRLPAGARRQPDGVQRRLFTAPDMPGRLRRCASAAASWSWSTRAAPAPRRWLTNTTSSAPALMPTS